MLAVSVDLGSIKVAGKTPNLSLTLSSSCTVALPPSWPETPSAQELSQASSAGKIWISKAGSCQIEVSTLVNGQVPDTASFDPSIMTAIASFPSDCPVWKHLGLELRTNHASHAPPDRSHARASYFLHHPDLSSEMIAPSDLPSAHFQGLRCEVNYSFRSSKSKTRSKTQAPKPQTDEPLNCARGAEGVPHNHTYGLRSNPKRSRRAAVAQEEASNASPNPPLMSNPQLSDHEQDDVEALVAEAIADMACLLDFAFRKLIGVKGACPGMRTIKNTASPSLIDIAPAVWDLQYLQTMSAHAQVIPSIAAGIARLTNARSASLREKLDQLTQDRTPGNGSEEPDGADVDTTDEVKKRLWLLCQTRIRPEPIKRLCVPRQTDGDTANQPSSQLGLPGRELDIPPGYVDDFDFDSGGLVAMENHDLVADHDQYDMFPEILPGSDYPEMGALGQAGESYMEDGGEPASDEWTHSSEGDYFYTDGQGNVYPIEREVVSEDDQIDWPSTPQLVGSDGFSQQPDGETEEYWVGGANRAYIMYHEDWSPDAGVHIHAEDDAGQAFLSPHPDSAPLSDWAED